MKISNSISRYRRRLASVVTLVIVVTALTGCDVDLYSHQPERDANEMMAVLLQSGLDVDKKHQGDGTYAVRVDDSDRAAAIAILENHGLPRQKHMTMRDLFPGDSIVASPLEERARFIFALEQNLQQTLSLIDGVLSARVHVVLPENNPFADKLQPSSASVFLKTQATVNLDSKRSDIKRIVSNSIEGLSYRDVTLTVISAVAIKAYQARPVAVANQNGSLLTLVGLLVVGALAVGIASTVRRKRAITVEQTQADAS